METTQNIILPSDSAAATLESVEGWVSRQGHFYGQNEVAARKAGATHEICDTCKNTFEHSGYTVCEDCREIKREEQYKALPTKKWVNESFIYSDVADVYFQESDELEDYCVENECKISSLRLLHTDEHYLSQIESDNWCDELPEDGELPEDVQIALDALNKVIEGSGAVSFYPNKISVQLSDDDLEFCEN